MGPAAIATLCVIVAVILMIIVKIVVGHVLLIKDKNSPHTKPQGSSGPHQERL